MTSLDVTLRSLSLGIQDAVTGWYAKSFADATIKMVLRPKGSSFSIGGFGYYAKYPITGFTADVVYGGDEIKDPWYYYQIEQAEEQFVGDQFSHRECSLVKLQFHQDEPAYGTGATVNDPRRQARILLDAKLVAANLLENDGATPASYITCWNPVPYPIVKVLASAEKNVDLVFAIGIGDQKSLVGHNKIPYGYNEKVPIEVSAINKLGIAGDNLMWQGIQELRRIVRENPLGSVRDLEVMQSTTKDLGSETLFSTKCVLDYTRDVT
jgi:hypothetical protein